LSLDLDLAENPDSKATAGIEPAMKVLQTPREIFRATPKFVSNIANCGPG